MRARQLSERRELFIAELVPAIQFSSERERREILLLLRNDVVRNVLLKFMGWKSKREDESYVRGRVFSSYRLDV